MGISKGTKMMSAKVKHHHKTITFKDSCSLIPTKLEKFPKMFKLECGQKELYHYNYYTQERLKTAEGIIAEASMYKTEGIIDEARIYKAEGIINEAGEKESIPWTKEQYEQFRKNINAIPGCRIDDEKFDMWKYCEFYCKQDVRLLREGFTKFREGFLKDFDIDVHDFPTICSIADEVFKQRVYYPNGNLYKVGGVVRQFMQQAVHGGRCMTALNKKWHTKIPIQDYDAASLYPSAMSRLYTVEGIPTVLKQDQLTYDFIKDQSAFVVEIEITKVNKQYRFPLVKQKIN